MDGRTLPKPRPRSDEGESAGTDEVSRLWAGLEHQQEVLGPIAVELMDLLRPEATGVTPSRSEPGITSRG